MSGKKQKAKKDDWQTPEWIIEAIEEHHGTINTDPSQGPGTEIGDTRNFDEDDDGLSQPWLGTVFCNPPFSMKEDFLEKAVNESSRKEVGTIFVVTPDCTDTKTIWHEHIAPDANYVWFSYGRISYLRPDGEKVGSPTFGTAISVFGETTQEMLEWFDDNGHLVQTVNT
jgi:hypothetical protein